MVTLSGFLKRFKDIDYPVADTITDYIEWVSTDQHLIFRRDGSVDHKSTFYGVKCAKRGNDVYAERVYKKFSKLADFHLRFFESWDKKPQTWCLFLTLTFDVKLMPRHQAWLKISYMFNLFMSNMRKKFGKTSTVRVYEAFDNEYPHVHAILLFEEFQFDVIKHVNTYGKRTYRIDYDIKTFMNGYWHSNIDVQAMPNTGTAFQYLTKYLWKNIEYDKADKKGLQTLALSWAYRKRSFSVGGYFRERYSDLITHYYKHNSNSVQTVLQGKPYVYTWVLVGIVPSHILGYVPQRIDKADWWLALTHEQIIDVDDHINAYKPHLHD